MAKTQTVFEVEPIFSLDSFPIEIKKPILPYEEAINQIYGTVKELYPPRLIAVSPLPRRMQSLSENSMTIQDAALEFEKAELFPAPAPYLLGLFKKFSTQLLNELEDAFRIDLCHFPDPFLFPAKFGRLRQLYLQKTKGGFTLDISEYIKSGVINSGEGFIISGSSVRTIVFADEKITWQDIAKEEVNKWSGKLIG